MKKTARFLLCFFALSFAFFALQTPLQALAQVFPGPQLRSISVNAIVPPTVGDFQFDFNIEASEVHQEQTLTYEITYGASESAGLTTTNTIVVNYSGDKAPDKSYLVEYVSGSASKGYGGAEPVIDPINRTITWRITLPEDVMDQKLTFQLRTNDSYRDPKQRVTFTNRVNMSNEYVTMAQLSRNQDYLYDPTRVKPGPTATPAPVTSPTPTVTPSQIRILDISFTKVTDTEASVAISTDQPSRIIVRYGTDPKALTQTAQSTRYDFYNVVDLKNLQPGSTYYLQITVINTAGRSLRSEVYTFETATQPQQLLRGKDAYVITSNNTVVLSNILDEGKDGTDFALLPTNTAFQLIYTLGTDSPASELEVIVRGNDGITHRVAMTRKDNRTYIAQLRTTSIGTYNLEVIQTDDKGNLMSRKISSLKVVSPIRVLELGSNSPLIDARVLLAVWSPSTNRYEPLDTVLGKNPSFTDINGEVSYILQQGKYQIAVSAFGYQARTVTFTLGPNNGEEFPTVHLERDPFDLIGLANYVKTLMIDSVTYMLDTIQALSKSIRAFTSVATASLVSTIALGFMLFNIRTDIRLRDLVPFFIFHVALSRKKHAAEYIFGTIVSKNGMPVSGVRIEAMLATNNTVLAHTTSSRAGGFRIDNDFEHPYIKLRITKEGYPEIEMIVPTDSTKPLQIRLDQHKQFKASPFAGIKHVAGGFFEVMLIVSLLLELLFIEAFGIAKTLPFIVLTFFNLALWIFYQREHKLHH